MPTATDKTLTKAELSQSLAEQVPDLDRQQAAVVVEGFFDLLKDRLVRGEDVKLMNFGRFHVRDKTARPGRNPKTGEEVTIEPRRVVTFHPSTKLKQALKKLD